MGWFLFVCKKLLAMQHEIGKEEYMR